jgi:hypothetical protein
VTSRIARAVTQSLPVQDSRHRAPADPPLVTRSSLGTVTAFAGLALAAATVWTWMSTTDAREGFRHVSAGAPAAAEAQSGGASAVEDAASRLAACRAEVAAGEAAVAAANQSYRDWSAHTQAQVDLDAGRTTTRQATAIWADTGSRGQADVAAFDAALAAYRQASGACAGLSGVPGPDGASAQACAARGAAIATAAAAGEKVNADWAAHVRMEAGEESLRGDYPRVWRDMVRAAPAHLRPFKAAYDALSSAASCPVPR